MTSTIPIAVLSFTGVLLVITLFPSYYRARNVPVLLFIFWLTLTSFCIGLNSAAWQGSVSDKWKAYCEISIRVNYAAAFALQSCSLLLLRRLEAIAATRYVSMTDTAKKRRTAIELTVGLILPALFIALAVISEGHCYDIIEGFGPVISIYPSVLSVLFSTIPPLLASIISVVYALLCAYWLFVRRRQLSAVLSSSGTGINFSQYIRLFALSCMELLWTVPINWTVQMHNLLNDYGTGSILYPYTSWASVHADYWVIGQYTTEQFQQIPGGKENLRSMYLGSMSIAISCFLFFGFLGTSSEISKELAARFQPFLRLLKPCLNSRASERYAGAHQSVLYYSHLVPQTPRLTSMYLSPTFALLHRRQESLTDSLSQPPRSPSEDTGKNDIQIEVLVERTV